MWGRFTFLGLQVAETCWFSRLSAEVWRKSRGGRGRIASKGRRDNTLERSRDLADDPARGIVVGDPQLQELLARPLAHHLSGGAINGLIDLFAGRLIVFDHQTKVRHGWSGALNGGWTQRGADYAGGRIR